MIKWPIAELALQMPSNMSNWRGPQIMKCLKTLAWLFTWMEGKLHLLCLFHFLWKSFFRSPKRKNLKRKSGVCVCVSALPCGCAGASCPTANLTRLEAARWRCCMRTRCDWITPSPLQASTACTSPSATTSASCRPPSASTSGRAVSGLHTRTHTTDTCRSSGTYP